MRRCHERHGRDYLLLGASTLVIRAALQRDRRARRCRPDRLHRRRRYGLFGGGLVRVDGQRWRRRRTDGDGPRLSAAWLWWSPWLMVSTKSSANRWKTWSSAGNGKIVGQIAPPM